MRAPNDGSLTADENDLVATARDIIKARHRPGWHEIGAALRTLDGAVFAAVHIEASVGRVAVCAEAIAIGMAIANGGAPIDTIVAVNSRGDVVAPCGMCREMLSDYAPTAHALLLVSGTITSIPVKQLLPYRSSTDDLT